jgi:hypothetical protein
MDILELCIYATNITSTQNSQNISKLFGFIIIPLNIPFRGTFGQLFYWVLKIMIDFIKNWSKKYHISKFWMADKLKINLGGGGFPYTNFQNFGCFNKLKCGVMSSFRMVH